MNYKGIELILKHKSGNARLVQLKSTDKALRVTTQAVWIPLKHFKGDELLPNENIDYIFRKAPHMLVYAGYHQPIEGIIRRSTIKNLIDNELVRQLKLAGEYDIK